MFAYSEVFVRFQVFARSTVDPSIALGGVFARYAIIAPECLNHLDHTDGIGRYVHGRIHVFVSVQTYVAASFTHGRVDLFGKEGKNLDSSTVCLVEAVFRYLGRRCQLSFFLLFRGLFILTDEAGDILVIC